MSPRVGYVAMPLWQAWREQEAVDGGSREWRLDPVVSARVEGATRLGLREDDPFFLQGMFQDELSGRAHAFVKVLQGDSLLLLDLCQPIRSGADGIWTVERLNEMVTEDGIRDEMGILTGYVHFPDEDLLYEQEAVEAGRNPWRLHPLQVAQLTGTTRLGFEEADRFLWRAHYREAGSGRNKAVVWAVRGQRVYQVELYQPALQGEGGVWAVEHVMPLRFTNPPYSRT